MRTEEEIRTEVVWALQEEPKLSGVVDQINVTVRDEIVTLFGVVANDIQKYAARSAALKVKGVRAVILYIVLRTPETSRLKTDIKIGEAIKNALSWHPEVNEEMVSIKVDQGYVYLEGTVNWEYERRAVEKAIKNVHVKGIVNRIRIKNNIVEAERMRKKIKTVFQQHSNSLNADEIWIEVSKNTVLLKGKVHSESERNEAELLVKSVHGVEKVINKLSLSEESLAV